MSTKISALPVYGAPVATDIVPIDDMTGPTTKRVTVALLVAASAPKAHAASHASGGGDVLTLAEAQVTGLVADLAAKAALTHAAQHASGGSDPVTLAESQVTNLTSDLAAKAALLHAAQHASGGSDPVTLAESQVTGLTSDLALKAPLASPALTGTPSAPTATAGTSTTQLATTAFVGTAVAPSVFTSTSTGNLDDLDFSNASLIRMNNATLATIRGLKAGVDGQRVRIVSIGAGQVDLSHQDTGDGTAASRLINTVTVIKTSLAAGKGYATYVYDATTARWRLAQHVQGAPISYTPTWVGFSSNPAIGNGTLTGQYTLRGRLLLAVIEMIAGSTTTFGSGFWEFSFPSGIGPASGALPSCAPGLCIDVVGGINYTMIGSFRIGATGVFGVLSATNVNVDSTHPFTWANTDQFRIALEMPID